MTVELAPVEPGHTLARRVWHVVGGLLVVAPYGLGLLERPAYALLLALLLASLLAVDLFRLYVPAANAFFVRTLRRLLLPRDVSGLNGSTYFVAGILLAALLFPEAQAVVGALFLVLGDFAAGVVGRRWGRTRPRPGGKSLEGSLACFLVCLAIALPTLGGAAAAGGALAATVIEYAELALDDNLLIPPVSAAVLFWLS